MSGRETATVGIALDRKTVGGMPLWMFAVERCERAIPPLTLRHLLTQEYKIDDIGYLDYFYALANEGKQRDWTQVFVDPTPEWKRMYIGLNSGASTKHMYNPTLIPGAFQAPGYMVTIAQHVLRASKPEMAEGIAGRRARQARLTDQANPLQASAVIGEATFRVRFPGSDQIMAEQSDHLARVCDLPTVDLRVLPFTVAESKTYSQPFVRQWASLMCPDCRVSYVTKPAERRS